MPTPGTTDRTPIICNLPPELAHALTTCQCLSLSEVINDIIVAALQQALTPEDWAQIKSIDVQVVSRSYPTKPKLRLVSLRLNLADTDGNPVVPDGSWFLTAHSLGDPFVAAYAPHTPQRTVTPVAANVSTPV